MAVKKSLDFFTKNLTQNYLIFVFGFFNFKMYKIIILDTGTILGSIVFIVLQIK